MRQPIIILTGFTLLASLIAYLTGGFALIWEGMEAGWFTLLQAVPLILAAFFVIGQLQQLISTDLINRLLQRFAGAKGIVLSSIGGGAFPGPPYVYYPFLASFKDKKIPFYLFFTFIVGKQVYDFARIPMEVSLINPGIALLRNIITAPFPIIMGLIARYIYSDLLTDDYFIKEQNIKKQKSEGGEKE